MNFPNRLIQFQFGNIRTRRNRRKGVTLLFVVSMISLFMLLATTFLVVSSQYLRGARSYAKSEIFQHEPVNELDQMLMMLLRDSRDPNNPVRGHGLLSDVYGYNTVIRANVAAGTAKFTANSNRTFIEFVVENPKSLTNDTVVSAILNTNKNSYMGQLLTVTTGGMQGVTTRIVSHVFDNTTNQHYFRVFPILDDFFTDATDVENALNLVDPVTGLGPELIINGRPYVGPGAGLDVATAGTDYDTSDSFDANLGQPKLRDRALIPNQRGQSEADFIRNYLTVGGNPALPYSGDVNEDYDAPDYQNAFMAVEIPDIVSSEYQVTVLPSFHRPELGTDGHFRPDNISVDFPNFNLNLNPGTIPANYEWDVDNDNDLIKDSVWIDPNLPVVTDKSGRTYKRLFAVLIRDMDGKLNLNAHSHRWHAGNEFQRDLFGAPPTDPGQAAFVFNESTGSTLSTLTPSSGDTSKPFLALGQGFGPPEINLRTIVADNNEFFRLMYGDAANGVWGRNGQDFGHSIPRPGFVFADAVDQNTFLRFGNISQGFPMVFGGANGSYLDVHGRFVNGVDVNGQPVFSLTTLTDEIHENEYERSLMELSRYGYSGLNRNDLGNIANHQTDAPFSYAEIERILRGNDNDAKLLPNRIADLAPNTFNALNNPPNRARTARNRMNIGGHSFDMPVTPTDFVGELRRHLQASGLAAAQIDEQLEDMLPPELFMGLRFDINRPFGDGRDGNRENDANDLDVVPDNHWGLWSEDLVANPALLNQINEANLNETDANSNPLDLDNDGLVGNADDDEHLVRYRLAKNLYVMMRTILRTSLGPNPTAAEIATVIGDGSNSRNAIDLDGDGGTTDEIDLAIFVAQWAINVVDFRDNDSIMTPFEFDLNPFDGWDVDGNPLYSDVWRNGFNHPLDDGSGGTIPERDGYIVFGAERPNLLLTETFAFHDRRTEDLDTDADTMATTTDMPDPDDDRDSRLKPQGSMFVELFNPNGVTTARTDDVYERWANDTSTNVGIDLRAVSETFGVDQTGAISTKKAPVWRIVVAPDETDLDIGLVRGPNDPRENIERVIYFVSENEYTPADLRYDLPSRTLEKNGMFLLSQDVYDALNGTSIIGNSSAVIGTGGFAIDGSTTSFISPVGRRTDVTDETDDVKYVNTRSILIEAGYSTDSVIIRDMDGTELNRTLNYRKETLAIPFNGLNISEPVGGYVLSGNFEGPILTIDAGVGGSEYTETGFFEDAALTTPFTFDQPLDENSRTASTLPGGDNFPANNTTDSSYRFLHLQRLANPLAGWHPETNPYLTVDTMPIDLSVFDGTSVGGVASTDMDFATKERGETEGTARNLWSIEPTRDQVGARALNDNHVFSFYIENPTTANVEEESLGRTKLGARDQINHVFDFTNNTSFTTTPSYPSLPWNNRPFISQYELMLVPHSRSSRLLYDYKDVFEQNMNYGNDVASSSFNRSFGYVLNFHQSSLSAAADKGPDFHRIFDYTNVPSKFSDTDIGLDVATFGTATAPDLFMDADEFRDNGDSTSVEDNNDPGFRSPFNLLSKFREPGKINVNTVFTPQVWDGLQGGISGQGGHEGTPWVNWRNSRRGDAGQILDDPAGNSRFYFNNPLRGGHAGNLVARGSTRNPVDMGLMRNDGTGNAVVDSSNLTVDANRHPYLKFLTRARMANLTTTRSNVYAVWITVGYFEFDPTAGPTGQGQLGAELGSLTGEVERHRAFYMIDRSIPVGFEPGKNHNVDKTIMLRRYIE